MIIISLCRLNIKDMKRIITLAIIAFIIYNCSSTVETVKIVSIDSDAPVWIDSDASYTRFLTRIPLAFEYSNNSLAKKRIGVVDYYYNPDHEKSYLKRSISYGWTSLVLKYQYIDKEYVVFSSNGYKKEYVSRYSGSKNFIAQTRHMMDTSAYIRDELSQYIDIMKSDRIYRLEVGTLSEFKERHPELTDILLKGDSISFQVYNSDNRYDYNITMSVEY